MKWESVVLLFFLMILVTSLSSAHEAHTVRESETISIRSDGSIYPPTAPISTVDNVTYTLAGNITNVFEGLDVERSNIVIDGSGFALEGSGADNSVGIILYKIGNVTIQNTCIKNFEYGIDIENSSNNNINGNNITDNLTWGILLSDLSYNNSISENTITNNYIGILLSGSSNSSISGNRVTNHNFAGILIELSDNISIDGNNVADNFFGIWIGKSSINTVCHNNFINNTLQAQKYPLGQTFWDNGFEGNYWSDYNGTDVNHDGIGDTSYVIGAKNADNYPLMGTFYEFTVPDGMLYNIATVSNFTILDLYSLHELRIDGSWYLVLEFTAVIPKGTVGFCRIDIPRVLIDGPYHVFTLGGNFTPTELPISNSSHAFLYFTFNHSGPVIIVPEFPSFLILPLFFIATLLAVTFYKRRQTKTT